MRTSFTLGGLLAIVVGAGAIGTVTDGRASSHREAPYISTDQTADATDVYAFVAPDAPDAVTFVMNYVPFGVPSAGPNWYKFGDDVLYEVNIDNDGDAIDDLSFQFKFRSNVNPANPFGVNTFLYNTGTIDGINDNDQNIRQFYSVSRLDGVAGATRQGTVVADNLQVAPARVGPKTYSETPYEEVAEDFEFEIGDGIKVFAGPRDDPFFVDLGGIFDLLNVGQDPEDYLEGLNVMSIVIQVPKDQLTADGNMPSGIDDNDAIIGVRTTAYRQSVRVLRQLGESGSTLGQIATGNAVEGGVVNRGPWVQVSRLDLPLINEAVILLKDKDRWNGSKPANDGQFLTYVQNSHLAALLDLVLGVDVPANPRTDLVEALLLGIDGLNRPDGVAASSQLRLNMAVPPTVSPERLGVLAMDTAGFPNGRRLTDDVVDIELAVIAGCLQGGAFAGNCALGDGINTNDKAFLAEFPYLAAPHDYKGTSP